MATTDSSAPRPYTPRPSTGSTGGYQQRPPMGAGGPSAGGPGGRFKKPMMKRRVCRICDERKGHIDWKAVNYIRSFVTDRGKILAGRSKGTCSGCQRQLARAIKRARYMALIPTSPV